MKVVQTKLLLFFGVALTRQVMMIAKKPTNVRMTGKALVYVASTAEIAR